MRKVILGLFIGSATLTVSALNQAVLKTGTEHVAPAEKRSGTITEVNSNGGKIIDNGNGNQEEFIHPGANVEFVVGDNITYLKVTTPSGNVIITNVKKKA